MRAQIAFRVRRNGSDAASYKPLRGVSLGQFVGTDGRWTPGAEHQEFRPDVAGLRAVAILLVVLYHVPVRALSGGYVGVDVFFVISGFLITRQLVRELRARGRISFLAFYARRARRILPAATLAVMATAIASAVVLNPLAAQRALNDGLSAVYFGANVHFAAQGADYFNAGLSPSPVQHYWSLSVEEQFYIVWPLLLIVASLVWLTGRHADAAEWNSIRRPALAVVAFVLVLAVAASLFASIRQTATNPSWAYFSILTRAWELAVGALVALALPSAKRLDPRLAVPLTWAGLACIGVAAASFSDATAYPGQAALLPVLGATAVIAGGSAASHRWGAGALLGTPPFQRTGEWSYSWYLWHWPALVLAAALLGHALTEAQGLAVAAISLGIAVISFVVVERPIRRVQVLVRRPSLGLAFGGALVGCAIGVVALSSSLVGLPVPTAAAAPVLTSRATKELTASQLRADLIAGAKTRGTPANLLPPLITATRALPLIVVNGCHLQHPGIRSEPCIYGDTTSSSSVVLFGDSHAAAWFPALDPISKEQHWRLVDLTKAGCPPAEVNIDFAGSIYTNCTLWRRNAEAQIAALHPALVILEWARYIEAPEARPLTGVPTGFGSTWQNGVAAIFSFLHRNADHVLFVSDGPTLDQWAPDCVSGHLSNVRPCTVKRHAAVRLPRTKAQELALAKREGISTLDPTSWFCAPTVCPVIVGNILLYRDNAHMTPAWSRFIAPMFADSLTAVMKAGHPVAARLVAVRRSPSPR
jgi:peptidoglycan/LPS O-acetylase OafA/YrhL